MAEAESAVHGPKAGRVVGATLAGIATFAVVMLLCFTATTWIEAGSGLEPTGPSCTYTIDSGSGTVHGTERMHWGIWPERECVSPSGEAYTGGYATSQSPLSGPRGSFRNAVVWAAVMGAALISSIAGSASAGVLVAFRVHRRR